MEVVVTAGAIIGRAKLQSNHHHQQTNTKSFLQAGCTSCLPTNSVKHWREKYHIPWTCLPQTHPTLSLATNSSWLPWGGLPCLSSALWCQYPLLLSLAITDINYQVCKCTELLLIMLNSSTDNMQEVQRRRKLQIPVEFIKNATLHTQHFGHWTPALTAANQCQRVWDYLHIAATFNPCNSQQCNIKHNELSW